MKKSTYIYLLIFIFSILDMKASNIDYQINNLKEKKIIFFGNSITQVWSDYTDFFSDNGYLNKGISGQTTDQMLLRFKKDVVDEKADCVVILAGINDLAENNGPISLEDIFKNIRSMVKIANDNNIKFNDFSNVSSVEVLEELSNVIFNLKIGEVSDVVETALAKHLIIVKNTKSSL